MLILIVNLLPPRKQPEPPQLWGAEGHHDRDSVAAVVSAAACVVGARWQIGRLNFFISMYATKARANARDMGLRILYSRGNPQGHNKRGEARKDNR